VSLFEQNLDRNAANSAPLTPLDFLRRAAAVYPDKIAVIHGPHRSTYRELYARSCRLASALISRGVGRGDTVAIMAPNTPAMLEAHYGVPMAGAVLNPLNIRLDAATIAFTLEHGGAKVLLTDLEFSDVMRDALRQVESPPLVVDIDDPLAESGEPIGALDYEALLEEGDPTADAGEPLDEWQSISLLYTSGTTGRPKGAVHRHRDMVVTSEHYGVRTLGLREDDVCFSAAKLFFAYGLGNAMTFPLWVGGEAVFLSGPPTPAVVHEIIETYKPTLYYSVPTLYAAQLKLMEDEDADLSSLRLCISAGEALPPHIGEQWERRMGAAVLDGIGSTEMLHIFISAAGDDIVPGSTGLPLPGVKAQVVDENVEPVADGEVGLLAVQAPTGCRYLNDGR